MTHFLEVGFLHEGLQSIAESTVLLKRLLTMSLEERAALEQSRVNQGDLTTHSDDVSALLSDIMGQADEMVQLLEQFESAPVIYTGEGKTADVLAMLERLMSGAPSSETTR